VENATRRTARAHLRQLALALVSLRRDGKGYQRLVLSDADREMYHRDMATVESELNAADRLYEAVGRARAELGEVLRTWGDE
jgi:hypothetical protein